MEIYIEVLQIYKFILISLIKICNNRFKFRTAFQNNINRLIFTLALFMTYQSIMKIDYTFWALGQTQFFLAAGEFKQVVLNKMHRVSDVLGVFHTEYEISGKEALHCLHHIHFCAHNVDTLHIDAGSFCMEGVWSFMKNYSRSWLYWFLQVGKNI